MLSFKAMRQLSRLANAASSPWTMELNQSMEREPLAAVEPSA